MMASSLLVMLALLAPIFRLTLQAHIDTYISSLQKSVTVALESVPSKVQTVRLGGFDGFRTILVSLDEDLEKYTEDLACIRAGDKDACVEFIQSQSENFAALIKALRADYNEIEARRSLWIPNVADLLIRLQSLKLTHLKKLSPEEAFNCAVVILTFNAGVGSVFDAWIEIGKLSKRFVPDQWTEFANWAIYVARPSVFTFPPQLFRHSRFSATQQIAMSKSLFKVVTGEQSFQQAGFNRPKGETGNASIDANYVLILIFGNEWDPEAVEQLGMLLVYFFEGLSSATILSANKIIAEIILCTKGILQPFANSSDYANRVRSTAIKCLVTNRVLKSLKEVRGSSLNYNCAQAAIASISKMDGTFQKAFRELDKENCSFIMATFRIVDRAAIIKDKLLRLSQLLPRIPLGEVTSALEAVNTILGLVNGLSPSDNACYAELYGMQPFLVSITSALASYATSNIIELFRLTQAINAIKGIAQTWSICYLLSFPKERLRFATKFISSMAEYVHMLKISRLHDSTAMQLSDTEVRTLVKDCLPGESFQQLFASVCTHIASTGDLTYTFLSGMLALAKAAFYDSSAKDYVMHVTELLKSRLPFLGAPPRNYLQAELPQPVRSLIYMPVISEWLSSPGRRSTEEETSYRVFAEWLVKNRHVSSTVGRVLAVAIEESNLAQNSNDGQ